METDFETVKGQVRVIDFMPVRSTFSSLVRIAMGLQGTVKMRSVVRLRFDYGAFPPWSSADGDGMIAKVGPKSGCLARTLEAVRECRLNRSRIRRVGRATNRVCHELREFA